MSSEQSAFIVYKSKYFNVVEGVRQGGVLDYILNYANITVSSLSVRSQDVQIFQALV
jgi:hypothetical protein